MTGISIYLFGFLKFWVKVLFYEKDILYTCDTGSLSLITTYMVNLTKDMPAQMVMPEGELVHNALLVYHPGLSTFPLEIAESIASGLGEQDWSTRIERAGAYNSSPLAYDLLIFSGSYLLVESSEKFKNLSK